MPEEVATSNDVAHVEATASVALAEAGAASGAAVRAEETAKGAEGTAALAVSVAADAAATANAAAAAVVSEAENQSEFETWTRQQMAAVSANQQTLAETLGRIQAQSEVQHAAVLERLEMLTVSPSSNLKVSEGAVVEPTVMAQGEEESRAVRSEESRRRKRRLI